MTKREFKGIWIPKEIWLSEKLTLQEKVFFIEIDSLNDPERGCFASNKYFGKFFGLSEDRCSEIIMSLKKKRIIETEVDKSSGKSIRKIVPLFEFTTTRKVVVGVPLKSEWPLPLKSVPNNKDINNKDNNTKNIVDKVDGKEVNEIIFLFKAVNPMIQKLYEQRSQRQAIERMLKEFGRERLQEIIQSLPLINAQKYWRKSTTPIQLEDNIGSYEAKKNEQLVPQLENKAIKAF